MTFWQTWYANDVWEATSRNRLIVEGTAGYMTMALESHQESNEPVSPLPSSPCASANSLRIKSWSTSQHQNPANPKEGPPVAAVRPFCRPIEKWGDTHWIQHVTLNQIGESANGVFFLTIYKNMPLQQGKFQNTLRLYGVMSCFAHIPFARARPFIHLSTLPLVHDHCKGNTNIIVFICMGIFFDSLCEV